MKEIFIIKRDGRREPLDIAKMHFVVEEACEGLSGVSSSQIEMNANLQFTDGMTSKEIQQILIKSAADLITLENPNYQYAASRLMLSDLRKQVFGKYAYCTLQEIIDKNIALGVYDPDILQYYTPTEIKKINTFIKHDRDMDFTFAGLSQMVDKYLVQDRTTHVIFETPQFAFILVAAILFAKYPTNTRLQYVKAYYDILSTFKLNLPTPVLAGVRTPTRQFASCVLIDVGDDLESIYASTTAIGRYTARRAGLGINMGRIRAINSPIRKGEVSHTGAVPFLKLIESAMKSTSQNGLRGGSGTIAYPIFHKEIESIIVLKNNKGSEDSRVRKLDYSISFSKLFYSRIINDEEISLFCPNDATDLFAAFGMPEFDELYCQYEKRKDIPQKRIKALDLVKELIKERIETGRIYIMNIDHMNSHSPFLDKVWMSNLCQEIGLPTTPIYHIDDETGEIALCILSSVNVGLIKDPSELEVICDLTVRALDELIDYQDYPVKAAEKTLLRRSLGVGFTGLAHYLAKHKVKYDDIEAARITHDLAEALQYFCLKASNQLAQEKGACGYFNRTKYSQGIFPIDTYKKDIAEILGFPELKQDWNALRASVKEFGLRHSTLTAQPPVESSSLVTNSTNGIESIKALMTVKKSKKGTIKQIVPQYSTLKNYYTLQWELPDNTGYMNIAGAIQMFFDQAISANLNYDPLRFEDHQIPIEQAILDLLYAYKIGQKTHYYCNVKDGKTDDTADEKEHEKQQQDLYGKLEELAFKIAEESLSKEDDFCEACTL